MISNESNENKNTFNFNGNNNKGRFVFKDRAIKMNGEEEQEEILTECGGNMDDNSLMSDDRFLERERNRTKLDSFYFQMH